MANRPGSLWHNRNFLLLWSGQLISSIGTGVSQLAFPLLTLALAMTLNPHIRRMRLPSGEAG